MPDTVTTLGNQLIRKMGKREAIRICEQNKWYKVLSYINTLERK